MKYLQFYSSADPQDILDGDTTIFVVEMDELTDGALAFGEVLVQGLGPNNSRVSLVFEGPNQDISTVEIKSGEFFKITCFGAKPASDGTVQFSLNIILKGSPVRLYYSFNSFISTKLLVVGDFPGEDVDVNS